MGSQYLCGWLALFDLCWWTDGRRDWWLPQSPAGGQWKWSAGAVRPKTAKQSNSRKSVTWWAVPDAPMLVYVERMWRKGQRPWRGRWPMIPHRAIFSSFWFPFVWRPDLLTKEPDLWSEMPDLGSWGPYLRPELKVILAWVEGTWSNEGFRGWFWGQRCLILGLGGLI